jgi:translation elongation factor EF-Tu-like GTPase
MNRYSQFRLTVTATFAVQGRGTLVDGSLDWGVISVGDSVEVRGEQGCIATVITGMMMGPLGRPRPNQTQRLGLLLKGIGADDVQPGDVITSVGGIV